MLSMKEIKRRIKAIKNIQQITKAMKLIAATKLQRAQQKALSYRPYKDSVVHMARECALRTESPNPFFKNGKKGEVFLLFTSEKGLCGAFNANLIKYTQARLKPHSSLILIGRKGFLYFKGKGYNIKEVFFIKEERVEEEIKKISKYVERIFIEEEKNVFLVYSRFESVFRQRVTEAVLLPVPPAERRKYVTSHIYEPDEKVLDEFLSHYLYVYLLHAALESFASEHAARMIAMDAATSNASDMIQTLVLDFNKARQAAITKEITEITATKEAMMHSK